jgi:hypothetical protein
LFKYWNENKGDESVFWKMYPNVVASWEGKKVVKRERGRKPMTLTLSPSDTAISSPHDFVEAVAAAAAGGSRRTRKRRSTKRRATMRHRHY